MTVVTMATMVTMVTMVIIAVHWEYISSLANIKMG